MNAGNTNAAEGGPLAWMAGNSVVATLITLVMVPSFYLIVDDLCRFAGRWRVSDTIDDKGIPSGVDELEKSPVLKPSV